MQRTFHEGRQEQSCRPLSYIDLPIDPMQLEKNMLKATSGFTTDRASQYLQQMSKHFAHKTTVEYTETDSVATIGRAPRA